MNDIKIQVEALKFVEQKRQEMNAFFNLSAADLRKSLLGKISKFEIGETIYYVQTYDEEMARRNSNKACFAIEAKTILSIPKLYRRSQDYEIEIIDENSKRIGKLNLYYQMGRTFKTMNEAKLYALGYVIQVINNHEQILANAKRDRDLIGEIDILEVL